MRAATSLSDTASIAVWVRGWPRCNLRILIEEMIARKMRVHMTGKVERLRQIFIHGFRKAEATIERG